MILQRLDGLRGEFAQCEFLALADISSGTVLCVSTGQKIPQEKLDGYCAAATELLAGDTAAGFSAALGPSVGLPISTATVLLDGQVIFLLGSPVDENEVLLCRCGPNIDVDSFLAATRACLTEIAAT